MNKPPRSNWNVADNKLKPIPPFYPPIPPNNMIYINDASPSVVACRISECLRKRSIIVDYDDEAAVATCWSKGDNGSGEGELLLFHTGANMKRAMMMKKKSMSKGLNSRDSLSSNNQNGNGGDDNYDEFHKNVNGSFYLFFGFLRLYLALFQYPSIVSKSASAISTPSANMSSSSFMKRSMNLLLEHAV